MSRTILEAGIELSDADVVVLEDELLDIEAYVRGVLASRIISCTKSMDERWRPILDVDETVENIPADVGRRIAFIRAQPDYQSRVERDAAE